MPSQRDIEMKQAYITNLADKLLEEEDVNTVVELAKILEAEAKELEEMCKAFEAEMAEKYPPQPRQGFDVQLTPAQREKVAKETGIQMDTLFVDDNEGLLNESMITTRPEVVEKWAIAEGHRRRESARAEQAAAREAAAALEAIEDAEVSQEMFDLIEEKRKDPTFLGGLLQKHKPK